jgi:E3 ubiquitin-protein ligase RBBP6
MFSVEFFFSFVIFLGHFIQHCPTNGNPAYDPRRFKPPTGIPKSMLMTTPDGSYSLPGGAVAVLQPNEYAALLIFPYEGFCNIFILMTSLLLQCFAFFRAAFEKEIEGIPTLARAAIVSTELLPENLRCPICKEIMKDAVLTSKCCFNSFCDKCIGISIFLCAFSPCYFSLYSKNVTPFISLFPNFFF